MKRVDENDVEQSSNESRETEVPTEAAGVTRPCDPNAVADAQVRLLRMLGRLVADNLQKPTP